jgi:hypothetical protein
LCSTHFSALKISLLLRQLALISFISGRIRHLSQIITHSKYSHSLKKRSLPDNPDSALWVSKALLCMHAPPRLPIASSLVKCYSSSIWIHPGIHTHNHGHLARSFAFCICSHYGQKIKLYYLLLNLLIYYLQTQASTLSPMNRQFTPKYNPLFNERAYDRANKPSIDHKPRGKKPQPGNILYFKQIILFVAFIIYKHNQRMNIPSY